jgi:Icc-related predicted phosphoesterase
MKLLLFSDLHRDTTAATRMVELSRDADVVIGAGDFANARTGVSTCIEILKVIEIPSVLVPGNNESYDELVAACANWPSARVLHGTGVEIKGVPFFGIGGGIPITPFGSWSYDFSEVEAERLLRDCPVGAVLVSHSPPKGAVDVTGSGQSLGSTAVRDAVIRLKPRLVVCGHIHASAGKRAQTGTSTIINAGPAGLLLDLATVSTAA